MEIEAKFVVPNEAVLQTLIEATTLGGFRLTQGSLQLVEDSYRDTSDRQLLRAGYAYRIRHKEGMVLAAIKSLGRPIDGVHTREEHEVMLDSGEEPEEWPASEARDLVFRLAGGQVIKELFRVKQERHVREATRGEEAVAELSIDMVHMRTRYGDSDFLEVEAELLPNGNLDDLEAITRDLQRNWHLRSQSQSKFERGLALLDMQARPVRRPLSAGERVLLEEIARIGSPMHVRRAKLLLFGADGLPAKSIAPLVGLSDRQVRHWLRAFRQKGMAVFPERVISLATASRAASLGAAVNSLRHEIPAHKAELVSLAVPDGMGKQSVLRPRVSVEDLCERYAIDQVQAQHIAKLGLAIFDATVDTHSLPYTRRELLSVAAALHRIGHGQTSSPKKAAIFGHDIILAYRIDGLKEVEQDVIACVTAFQRKRLKQKRLLRDAVFQRLPEDTKRETLALAAILRAATGLAHSQAQSSRIVLQDTVAIPADGSDQAARIVVPVQGPSAEEDSACAQRRTTLWNDVFDVELNFVPQDQLDEFVRSVQKPAPTDWSVRLSDHKVLAEDPMSEAGRKVLRLHFVRMLKHEEGTRQGQDIEDLHDMRVATRRMRSAFNVFVPYFDPKILTPFVKNTRRIGRVLGRVRDLDVFMEKAEQYLNETPMQERVSLEPLLESWRVQRERARVKMLQALDGKAYSCLVETFGTFLMTENAGAHPVAADSPTPYRVYQLVPRLIYGRYEAVRGYEHLVTDASLDTLHSLRIEFKRLRYSLEFFADVLGPEVGDVVKEVVTVQDHLGNLHDADVACGLLIAFLQQWSRARHRERIRIDGVTRYLLVKQLELRNLVDTFPQTWQHFSRPELRRKLAMAVAAL